MAKLLIEVNCGIELCTNCHFYYKTFFTEYYCHLYRCVIKNDMRCKECLAAEKAAKELEEKAGAASDFEVSI